MRASDADPVTLLVVHWNNSRACLATVRAFAAQWPNLRTIVLDNASAPNEFENVRSGMRDNTEVIRLSHNHGWGPALNIGLRKWLDEMSGEFCLISAHDAVPSPECIPLLLETTQRDEHIGISCPQYPDATVPTFTAPHGVKLHVDLARERGTPQFVPVPHGTLMLVRRACLREIGLFDERYFAYGDEHELGARAKKRGWKIALVWGAIVANPETSTPSGWRSYLFTRNSLLLVRDYFGRAAVLLRALVIAINAFRQPPTRKMRWRGVRDYFTGRFGVPTFE